MATSPMADRRFFLEMMTFEQLRDFAGQLGVAVTDSRWRAPRIAEELARRRSLQVTTILAAFDATQLETACGRLGLTPTGDADALREQVLRALGATPRRDLVRAVARKKHDLVALPATLIRVVDGDTILVQWEGAETFVRIRGVDAPECRESDKSEADLDRSALARTALWSLGEAATRWLEEHLRGRALFLHCQPTPAGPRSFLHHHQYRLLAYVTLDAADGPDVGEAMLRAGYALVWPRNVPTRRYLHPRSEVYVSACHAALVTEPALWKKGMALLCPRSAAPERSWTLDDCKDGCYRADWRAPAP